MLIDSNTKYLDPKADLTFKRVFGKHPDLMISLLNALLPLDKDQEIKKITYLPTELIPITAGMKNTIVDVLCEDSQKRKFTVEMQMEWTKSFMKRVLFNASKLYVDQAKEGFHYADLQPVYSLNLVNDIFIPDSPLCIHNYRIVHDQYTDKIIDGLHFTFVELPKFTPHTMLEKRMAVLWLRFLTEINGSTKTIPHELSSNPEISKALDEVRISAFSEKELRSYDKFWDIVRTNTSMLYDSFEDGITKGRAEGEKLNAIKNAAAMKKDGMSIDLIAKYTGLSKEEIDKL